MKASRLAAVPGFSQPGYFKARAMLAALERFRITNLQLNASAFQISRAFNLVPIKIKKEFLASADASDQTD